MKENNVIRRIIFMCLMCAFAMAYGQNQTFPDHVLRIYDASDPNLDTKLTLEKMMGVYLTHPPRRHRSEKITLKKDQVIVDVWQSVYGHSDAELQCKALRWLVLGRTQYVDGGRQILSERREFKRVTLRFHEVEHVKNSRRVQQGKEKVVRYLHATLSQSVMNKLNMNTFNALLENGECKAAFSRTFKGKISKRYTRKRRATR